MGEAEGEGKGRQMRAGEAAMVEEPGVAGGEAQAWPTVLLGEVTVHTREGK
jgi:hypothetical protein